MTGSVLVLPRRYGTFFLPWFVVSGVLGSRPTWTRPRVFLSQSFAPGDIHFCVWVGSSNFKLLGAPLGSSGWCEDLLGRRVTKARTLLTAIGKFPDAQGAFCLLRSCSGWSKVLYSCRTVPPDVHLRGLCDADGDIRSALCHLIGRSLSDDDWRLASLGITAGGLGARSAAEYAPAAYVASFCACRDVCGLLSTDFDHLDLDDGCRLSAAESSLRSIIPSGANIYAESDSPSQKSLSGKIEAQSASHIFADPALPRHRLHLDACRVPELGPGSRLTLRLLAPMSLHPSFARFCSIVSVCPSGITTLCALCVCRKNMVLRHIAIRDVVCSAVSEFTSVSPELEKPGLLLPPRHPDPGGPEPGLCPPPGSPSPSLGSAGRRPADVWVRLR